MATLMASPQVPSQAPQRVPTPARNNSIGEVVQRWLGWRPLAASLSFAAVLAVAVNLVWLQSSKDERLTDDVVASHVRSTLGQHLVDVASSDHHTVKPFLSSKLGFSPPVDELQIPGSVFLGGRVDYLDGRPVAALVYKQGEHVVNSFVWPSAASDGKPSFSAERGYQTAHWSHNGMAHWVISDVNREEFQAVVRAVQMTDSGR
jgi:anti-sigma factor RsiW